MLKNKIIILTAGFIFGLVFLTKANNPNKENAKNTVSLVSEELHARGGMPNFFAKALRGDSIKVGYLGGSITAQNGWRVFSLDWFKQRFPKTKFAEINAAIGGTGSDFGVFRVHDHVLKYNPDLVFVEFAVNDGGADAEKIIRSMEGIVRQVWQHNPTTDICFVYTIANNFLETEQSGQVSQSSSTMEKVADKYQIASINFGFEVAKQEKNNQLIFKGESKELNGIKVFSPDGVHPYPETGHKIYQEVLQRSFEKMVTEMPVRSKKHILHKPMALDNFANAQMVDPTQAKLSKNWKIIQTKNSSSVSGFSQFLQQIGKASQTGETMKVHFKGQAIGISDIMGPDAGKVIVEIDGAVKDTISRFDAYCTYRRMNYFLIDHLGNKDHEVVFRVLSEPFDKAAILAKNGNVIKNPDDYKENNWYVGKILIDGSLLP